MLRAVAFFALFQCLLISTQAQTQTTAEPVSLSGSVWAGTVKAPDSQGKFHDYPYTFQLLSGNKVRWHWEGSDFTSGSWRQTGNTIRMDLNDGYSTWVGTFTVDEMSGSAANKLGHKWTWKLTRQENYRDDKSAASWIQYSSTLGRFRVLLPSEPEVKEQPINTPTGKLINHVFLSKSGDAAIVLAYSDSPQSAEDPQVVLDRVRDATITGIKGKLISSEVIEIKGFPGTEFHSTTDQLNYVARIFIVNRRLYQLAAVSAPGDLTPEAIRRFFDSFELSLSQ